MMKAWKAIAAVAENRVIGRGLQIPWHIPEDFKHFKAATMGGVIVMGKNTWESFKGRPLPGRENVVISSTCKPAEGIKIFPSLDAFKAAYENDPRQIWIIGGAKLYESALPFCDELVISRVKMSPEGDILFPDISNDFILKKTSFGGENFDILYYSRPN